MPEFSGFLLDATGSPVASATVELFDRNTTTPARASTTTDANGYYTISHATEGRFDIRITSSSDVLFRKYDTAAQVVEIETANLLIRNPANTFVYDIVPAAIAANRQLNLPLITGTDTLASLGLAQTFSALQTFSVIPALPASNPTTDNQAARKAYVDDLTAFKVGSFTRDISVASGTQAVTGVGFIPQDITFLMGVNSITSGSIGFDDGTNAFCVYDASGAGGSSNEASGSNSIVAARSSGNEYTGNVTSLDADGFTITWTKTGSPTGTITIYYLARRR